MNRISEWKKENNQQSFFAVNPVDPVPILSRIMASPVIVGRTESNQFEVMLNLVTVGVIMWNQLGLSNLHIKTPGIRLYWGFDRPSGVLAKKRLKKG